MEVYHLGNGTILFILDGDRYRRISTHGRKMNEWYGLQKTETTRDKIVHVAGQINDAGEFKRSCSGENNEDY